VVSLEGDEVRLERQAVPAMTPELLGLFETTELSKYMTPEEYQSSTESSTEES
jgi:succinate dehydrogenase / fumarate reductase, flavoprotein subunit